MSYFANQMFFKQQYSLRKCRHFLKQNYQWYQKRGKKLSQDKRDQLHHILKALDEAILVKDRTVANRLMKQLETFGKKHIKKSFFEHAIELIIAIAFALVIATIVRQVWFEPYEIPTGSMRPTFREKDRLTVSKTTFGLNVPLQTKHFYFDPDLIQRTGVIIFSGDNLPLSDNEGTYFWVFPAKKRYIKRLIGKPGDHIYFYGGHLYGVDKEGRPLPELITASWMQQLEHVPILEFEGKITQPSPHQFTFHLMQQPIGRILFSPFGNHKGEINEGGNWTKDHPKTENSRQIATYSDFFGMGNFAMARLLTKNELEHTPGVDTTDLEEGTLYFELSHHPSLTYPKPLFYQTSHGIVPQINAQKTIIPLQKRHLDALMDTMYTARFEVKGGRAKRYDLDKRPFNSNHPTFPNVPDGTYEFYNGEVTQIRWQGIPFAIAKDHPLYLKDPLNIQKLFNLGIEMNTLYQPTRALSIHFPHRYVYFRDGDLYAMGGVIIKKDDPTLKQFLKREEERQNLSTKSQPYIAFKDRGPPLKRDGSYDIEFIRTFGVQVPEKHYLVLGDNHAMSSDSRVFGFVPEDNIEGAPSQIIWPPGSKRLGPPAQKPYPWINFPRAIVWTIALCIAIAAYIIYRYKMKKPVVN